MPREPALLTSAGRMPKRSQHRASEGMDAVASVRRRGVGSPELRPEEVDLRRDSAGLRCSDRLPHAEHADYGASVRTTAQACGLRRKRADYGAE